MNIRTWNRWYAVPAIVGLLSLGALGYAADRSSKSGAAVSQEDQVATISYESGDVSIVRDGQAVPSCDIGDPVCDDDQISTGAGATLTLDLLPMTHMKGSLTLQGGTSIVFRLDSLKGERQNVSELIMGSVAVKVARISGSPGFSVVSGAVACGVRGTEFEVTTSSGGDVLVGCTEGEVSCDSEGATASAVPGQAVEKLEGVPLARKAIAAAVYADYRKKWIADEEAAFARNAPAAARRILQRYAALREELGKAKEEVAEDRDLAKWMDERLKSEEPTEVELRADEKNLKDIHSRLERALRIDVQMRRIDAMVVALMNAIDKNDAPLMGLTLRPGYTVGDFCAHFEETMAKDRKTALELRKAIKTYRKRANRLEDREG